MTVTRVIRLILQCIACALPPLVKHIIRTHCPQYVPSWCQTNCQIDDRFLISTTKKEHFPSYLTVYLNHF